MPVRTYAFLKLQYWLKLVKNREETILGACYRRLLKATLGAALKIFYISQYVLKCLKKYYEVWTRAKSVDIDEINSFFLPLYGYKK